MAKVQTRRFRDKSASVRVKFFILLLWQNKIFRLSIKCKYVRLQKG